MLSISNKTLLNNKDILLENIKIIFIAKKQWKLSQGNLSSAFSLPKCAAAAKLLFSKLLNEAQTFIRLMLQRILGRIVKTGYTEKP